MSNSRHLNTFGLFSAKNPAAIHTNTLQERRNKRVGDDLNLTENRLVYWLEKLAYSVKPDQPQGNTSDIEKILSEGHPLQFLETTIEESKLADNQAIKNLLALHPEQPETNTAKHQEEERVSLTL